MAEKKQLKIGIILNYANMFIGNLIPIFYTPIMLSLLGQEEYGLYKLSSTVTSYLGLMSLGIGSAVTRYLIKARVENGQEEEERTLGLFLIIFRIIAVLSLVIGFVLMLNLDIWYGQSLNAEQLVRMQILVFIMTCSTAISFAISPYYAAVSSRERFLFLQCISIILTCFIPILNLVALYMGYASIGMAVTSLAVNVAVQILYRLYVHKKLCLKPKFKNLPLPLIKEIFVFSFWIFVANVAGQLYQATDTLMIGAMPSLATVGVAIYNVGIIFSGIIIGLGAGMTGLLLPKTNKLVFEGAPRNVLTEYGITIGRIQSHILIFVLSGFIVFGKPVIHFYVGDEYQDAYYIAILTSLPVVIPVIQNVFLNVTIAENRHRFRSLVYLIIAIVNVICTWLILNVWGIIGAAFITGICHFIGHGIIMNWYYWKKMELNIPRFWKKLLKLYIIPVLSIFIFLWIGHYIDYYSLPCLLVTGAVYCILMLVFQIFFCFNQYEKDLLLIPFRKITGRSHKMQ